MIKKQVGPWGPTCFGVGAGLDLFLSQEDVEQETYYHQTHSSYLDTVVVVPAKEETADEQDCTQDYHDCSQILLKSVHCYVVLFVSSYECKLNGFYPKNETISPFLWSGYV